LAHNAGNFKKAAIKGGNLRFEKELMLYCHHTRADTPPDETAFCSDDENRNPNRSLAIQIDGGKERYHGDHAMCPNWKARSAAT
jgi:hypothetical protein